jgi:putative transposase
MPPVSQFTVTRRNLPHWQQPGSVYFLTWRTRGVLLDPAERSLTMSAIHFWDSRRWDVYSAVVMPDHVHVLARPGPLDTPPGTFHDLSRILHSVKSYSSHQINALRLRTGGVWQDESYDRIVRDDAEFEEKWEYIRTNPARAELVAAAEEYPWLFLKALTRS